MTALKQLINRLKHGTPVTETETKAAREVVERMKQETFGMTWDYADSLLRDSRIKEQLEGTA